MEVINPRSSWEQQPVLGQRRFCWGDLSEEINENGNTEMESAELKPNNSRIGG